MRKKIFNILFITIFSILILGTKVNASNIVSTDKKVNSGDGNVTISLTSKQSLGAYNIELVDDAGLELVSSSAGSSGTANGKKISGASATGVTDLGSYTFKVPTVNADTTYKIKFRITGMADINDEDLPNVDNNAILTVIAQNDEGTNDNNPSNNASSNNNNTSTSDNNKGKSSEARLRDLGLTPKEYDFKGFKPDTYEYNIEVSNEAEKVYIYATTKDSNAKVKSGDGNKTLNVGENKFEIVVMAEDGKTKKTYMLNITRKEAEQQTPVETPAETDTPIQNENNTEATKPTEETNTLPMPSTENTNTLTTNSTSTAKTESTSTIDDDLQIVGKVNWLKIETWGQEQYILVAILLLLILTIIVSTILKIKLKIDEEEIEFPGAEELDKAMYEHQELSDNGEFYNDNIIDENSDNVNFEDNYYIENDNLQPNDYNENELIEVESEEENLTDVDDYENSISINNNDDIERKRMLEEYFANQDSRDTKVKKAKTRGKHF